MTTEAQEPVANPPPSIQIDDIRRGESRWRFTVIVNGVNFTGWSFDERGRTSWKRGTFPNKGVAAEIAERAKRVFGIEMAGDGNPPAQEV